MVACNSQARLTLCESGYLTRVRRYIQRFVEAKRVSSCALMRSFVDILRSVLRVRLRAHSEDRDSEEGSDYHPPSVGPLGMHFLRCV